jgi:hypothetical protein
MTRADDDGSLLASDVASECLNRCLTSADVLFCGEDESVGLARDAATEGDVKPAEVELNPVEVAYPPGSLKTDFKEPRHPESVESRCNATAPGAA